MALAQMRVTYNYPDRTLTLRVYLPKQRGVAGKVIDLEWNPAKVAVHSRRSLEVTLPAGALVVLSGSGDGTIEFPKRDNLAPLITGVTFESLLGNAQPQVLRQLRAKTGLE